MTIGQLAKRTGLTSSRIRFYEEMGLLGEVERKPNGYRTYSEETVVLLELITVAQNVGFSLEEIRTLLPSGLNHWNHDALTSVLLKKVSDIEVLEAELAKSKGRLLDIIAGIQEKPSHLDCADNTRRILGQILKSGVGDNPPALTGFWQHVATDSQQD